MWALLALLITAVIAAGGGGGEAHGPGAFIAHHGVHHGIYSLLSFCPTKEHEASTTLTTLFSCH